MPSPVYLPNPGIELESLALQADSLQTELSGKPYNYQKKKKKNQISNKNRSFFYQNFINLLLKLDNIFPQ